MQYLAGLVIVGLFFLSMHYFTELTKHQKTLVTLILLAVVLSAIGFNKYSNHQTQSMLNTVMKFNQEKTIKCDGIDVNSSNYTLSIGTYTFIGKEKTPNYGQMISASTCE
ncbi:hypothetical protein HUE87_04595 [Candidatus Sulfurimonas marisnigri]|uniref:Uncharacterized protein n=1 Tax=Candidatus Sulfurimonas marisnigri TaxID=2740405 RepID=A0A7S7M2R1_9BACT|nr:hypothetical protein [Candidatus Sulfurimonas marisnigri]QOY55518.1 hypothetical protein HUE87_04595 [Candidatus Sulfurimonas marisnigri]